MNLVSRLLAALLPVLVIITQAAPALVLEAAAAPRWTAAGGPEGGPVVNLVIDPADPRTLFAIPSFGLFKSTDGGATFERTVFPQHRVSFLAFDPHRRGTLWASGTTIDWQNGAVPHSYRTADGGASWIEVTGGPFDGGISGIAFAPGDPAVAYAVSPLAVFRSDDGARSWISPSPSASLPFRTHEGVPLAVDPRSALTVFAATAQGVFKSTDGGSSWVESDQGISSPPVGPLLINPADGDQLFVGAGPAGLFKSSDGGASWQSANRGLRGLRSRQRPGTLAALALAPSSPTTLYAGVSAQGARPFRLFRSDDAAATWQALPWDPQLHFFGLRVDPGSASHLYVFGGGGVAQSADSGGAFIATNRGLLAWPITGLAFEPRAANLYAVAGNATLFRGHDGGGTWEPLLGLGGQLPGMPAPAATGLAPQGPVAIDPQRPRTIYAAVVGQQPPTVFGSPGEAIARSSDGGATWTSLAETEATCTTIGKIAVEPGPPRTVYFGAAGFKYLGCESSTVLFRSMDRGKSWTYLRRAADAGVLDFALGAAPGELYLAGPRTILFSPDRGASWREVTPHLPSGRFLVGLAVSPITSALYVAATSFGVFGSQDSTIYRSANGGASWQAFPSPIANPRLAVDPRRPEIVYAYSGDQFFRSLDGGGTWVPLTDGLEGLALSSPLVFDSRREHSVFLYAGTDAGGVLRLQLSD